MTATVATGLDRIAAGEPDAVARVKGRRVGLLAHAASVDRRLRPARRLLEEAGARVTVLFGPEHGFGGQAQDMAGVGSSIGADGVAVVSLYGSREEDLSPRPEQLAGLDAVVVDLQDVGSRYYTFVWTAALVLRAAAAAGVETVVLDRPNPLGGDIVEGRPQRAGYRSFVGLYDVAVRHGLTLAEVVELVRRREGIEAGALSVVPVRGWRRAMRFGETGLPWVLPSPNMPTLDTARVYPGGCLIEGTDLSEGRGTTRPFEIWGGPGVDGDALAAAVAIDGAWLRPLVFQPTFQKHAGRACGGVQLHVTDERAFRPYEAYLRMLAALRSIGAPFRWREDAYEFVADRPAIDLLTGGPEARAAIDAGRGLDELLAAEQAGAQAFDAARQAVLLY